MSGLPELTQDNRRRDFPMGFRFLALMTLLALMTGCAAADRSTIPSNTYRNSYSFYDLLVSWETASDMGIVTISGTLKNQSYYYLRDPELTAVLIDAEGKAIAQDTFFFFPRQFALDEIAPFTIRLPVKEGQFPSRIRFTYRYRLAEEGMLGTLRFHSFEAEP